MTDRPDPLGEEDDAEEAAAEGLASEVAAGQALDRSTWPAAIAG